MPASRACALRWVNMGQEFMMDIAMSQARTTMEGFKPTPALAPYVTDIWAYEIPFAAQADAGLSSITLLPDGYPTMFFTYGYPFCATYPHDVFSTRSALCGFHTRPVQVSCAGDIGALTVRFTPWGLASFVPFSLEEVAERRIACRDFLPRHAIEDLESQLFELPTSLARVRRVEAFLLGLLRPDAIDRIVHEAMAAMAVNVGGWAIHQLARDLQLSERTLERRFRRSIGVPPKTFVRVTRLQDALRRRQTQASWVESALASGYYDQAHLIRDANDFFGLSPDALLNSSSNTLAEGFQSLAHETQVGAKIFR